MEQKTIKDVNIMTTNHLKIGVRHTPETLCIYNLPQTMGNVQHNQWTIHRHNTFW